MSPALLMRMSIGWPWYLADSASTAEWSVTSSASTWIAAGYRAASAASSDDSAGLRQVAMHARALRSVLPDHFETEAPAGAGDEDGGHGNCPPMMSADADEVERDSRAR